MKLLNPSPLYDSSPNAYSQLAVVPAGCQLVFVSGQGGDNPDGSFSPDFQTRATAAFRDAGGQRVLFGGHHPAATLIPVPCLALPQMQIEVDAVVALAA